MKRLLEVALLVGLVALAAASAFLRPHPAWFTVGGPLSDPPEPGPRFGPAYWKRGCLGFAWTTQQPDGEWRTCAGFPEGPRLEYRRMSDASPWTLPGVPPALDALAMVRDLEYLQHGPYARAAILSWRRTAYGEQALLVAEGPSDSWLLARLYRHRDDRQPIWRTYFVYHEPVDGRRELDHRPSHRELAGFVRASWWDIVDGRERFLAWGVDSEAWAWATGTPRSLALAKETERLKSYARVE